MAYSRSGGGILRAVVPKSLGMALVAATLLAGCSGLSSTPSGTALAAADRMTIGDLTAAPQPAPFPDFDTTPDTLKSGIVPDAVLSYAEANGPSDDVEMLMAYYAGVYGVPLDLVRRVAKRESTFNPAARNGPYWGLMQILPATARSMGYKGPNEGLLDPDINLKYAVRYLAGAYLVARGDIAKADRLYQRGFYYDAKHLGLLEETGLRP